MTSVHRFSLLICFATIQLFTAAVADLQIVYWDENPLILRKGDDENGSTLMYRTDPPCTQAKGIAVKLFFDASHVKVSYVFQYDEIDGAVGGFGVREDALDEDGNPETDAYAVIATLNSEGSFPGFEDCRSDSSGGLPLYEFALLFEGDEAFEMELPVMLETAAGFEGQSEALTVTGVLDSDNDGTYDNEDVFPYDPSEDRDFDGDGIGDNADPDDDDDGVADEIDAFPFDSSEDIDSDGDRVGNNADPDDDGDGIEDNLDPYPLDPALWSMKIEEALAAVQDQNLRICLQEFIGSVTQVANVTWVRCLGDRLRTLEGLENFVFLRSVQIIWQSGSLSLEPLAALKKLDTLEISYRGTRASRQNLSPLSGLTQLERLEIANIQIIDPEPIRALPLLRYVRLRNTGLRSLGFLRDSQSLVTLDVIENEITDLNPLQGKASILELLLGDNPIQTLGPISDLTQLQVLDISAAEVTDFGPISGFEALYNLNLSNTFFANLMLIEPLTRLQTLNISGTPINEVLTLGVKPDLATLSIGGEELISAPAVAQLTNLRSLTVDSAPNFEFESIRDADLSQLQIVNSELSDLGFLGSLNLDRLWLPRNQIADLTPIASQNNLTFLDLSFNRVVDLSPLAGLLKLNELLLMNNLIEDLSPLAAVLESSSYGILDVSFNRLKDLKGLEQAPISLLIADNNQLEDLSAIAENPAMQLLYVPNNRIYDLSPLSGLPNLLDLYVFNNFIRDLSPLSSVSRLRTLSASRNFVSDFSSLARLESLFRLDLGDNQIADLSPLESMLGLKSLTLSANPLPDDLSVIAGLTQLSRLQLADVGLQNISFLEGLTDLESLRLSRNQIRDISSLKNLTRLKWLWLDGNAIDDLSFIKQLNLYGLGVEILDDESLALVSSMIGITELRISLTDYVLPNFEVFSNDRLTAVRCYDCTGGKFADFALTASQNIGYLALADQRISSMSPLSLMPHLSGIGVLDDNFTNAKALFDIGILENIDIWSSGITDLSGIPAAKPLYISLDRTPVLCSHVEAIKEASHALVSAPKCLSSDGDVDMDGTLDLDDFFPFDQSESADSDLDGIGNNSDQFPNDPYESEDSDYDGVGDNSDNCPEVYNQNQTNTDGDLEGDACDGDDDNDGVSDRDEILDGTDPLDRLSCLDCFAALDVDADGGVYALTDGLLIIRYLFGFRGENLITGALGLEAQRSDPGEIVDHIDSLSY